MRLEAAVGGVIWSTLLYSGVLGHTNAHGVHRRHHDLHLLMKRDPTPTVNLVKRGDVFNAPSGWPTVSIPAGFTLAGGVEITPVAQMAVSAVSGSAALASEMAVPTPAVDPATWNKEVTQSCEDAINKLDGVASSDTGMAACYNVPFLDQVKGTFESELRIYNVSLTAGSFSGIDQDMMMVQMTYPSATFQEYSGNQFAKRDLAARQATTNGVFSASLVSIKRYVGQINPLTFNSSMSIDEFKSILTPNITIYANSPNSSQNASSQLSSSEASFNAGLFTTGSGSLTNLQFLLNNPAERIIAAAQGLPTPYSVPGLTLGVFPIGLIVTGVWMLAFFSTVAYGAMGRIKLRDQYRRDVKAYQTNGIRRM